MRSTLLIILLFSSVFVSGKGTKDTIYKTYHLKGGYTLQVRNLGKDSNATVLLYNGEKKVLNPAEKKLGLDVLGYVYADFDSTYIMMTHIDVEPLRFELINKASGETVLYGQSPFYRDTIKQIMMCDGLYGKGRGKIMLCNFKTSQTEYFPAPTDTPCFCCFCWKLVSLTDTEVKIEYENNSHQKVVKTYERK
jgi:hypothetical protein